MPIFHLRNGLLTEIQADSYVYSGTTYRALAPEFENALFVLATTISRPTGSRIVLDVGLKGMGTEFSRPELAGYPHIRECHFSEEHLQWQVESDPCPAVGEKVRIIPSHCCSTVNLHRRVFVIEDRKVADVWEIDGF